MTPPDVFLSMELKFEGFWESSSKPLHPLGIKWRQIMALREKEKNSFYAWITRALVPQRSSRITEKLSPMRSRNKGTEAGSRWHPKLITGYTHQAKLYWWRRGKNTDRDHLQGAGIQAQLEATQQTANTKENPPVPTLNIRQHWGIWRDTLM